MILALGARGPGIKDPLSRVTGQTLKHRTVSAEDEVAEGRHRHRSHSGLTVADIASQRPRQAGTLQSQHLLVVVRQPHHQHCGELLHVGTLVSQGTDQDIHQVLNVH